MVGFMGRHAPIVPCTIVVCLVVLHAAPAFASEEQGGAELGALLGYGTSNEPNVVGPGVGLRFGYQGNAGFYVGGLGLVHFGSSDEGEPSVRHYSQSARLELGYGIGIEPLELRPSLRAGFTHVTTPRDVDRSFWSPDVGVGATLLVRMQGPYVGFEAEARILARPVDNWDNQFTLASIAGYWVGGYRF